MPTVPNKRFLTSGLAAWPLLMAIATIDGILRETKLEPWFGMRIALIMSGIIMLVATYVVAWLLLAWWGRPQSDRYLWLLGAYWVALTIAFEVALVVFARGQSIATAFYGYHPIHLLDGNLILPGLALMLLAPVLVAHGLHRSFERPTPIH